MSEEIINEISLMTNISVKQITNTLNLLKEGNTIPFISRYRKEITGSLDEEQIRKIETFYNYEVNLQKRKDDVIRLIEEKGMLNDELKNEITNCTKLIEVEDIYRPYKEKKKTKATEAIKNGLEPLSILILNYTPNIEKEANKFINDKIKTVDEAINGAKHIISEIISDSYEYRKYLRNYIYKCATISAKIKKNAKDEKSTYQIYYDFMEKINQIKPHRVLAINRGEKDNILSVSINIDKNDIINYICNRFIKGNENKCVDLIKEAIVDSYDRLIFPSVEREIRSELKDFAEQTAIENFALNLEKLLLTPPIKEKTVLGFDPAFRTGCKLAVLDPTGKVLAIEVIYPNEPHNKTAESEKIIIDLINKFKIDIIAIGNGTASRESEIFIANTIKKINKKVEYIIVNEAGASVYSASEEAINEFPELTVEKRSAISIGRRLQDALSELVKIDPKSIGVGLYQHDVSTKNLDESLTFIITKIVNQVGVNINTASKSILKYISGLSNKTIDEIINYKKKNGKILNRMELKKIKGVNAKTFEQAIGFLRIDEGTNPLDRTAIHPESYTVTKKILSSIDCNETMIGSSELIEKLNNYDINKFTNDNNLNIITTQEIIENLKKPLRDPRDEMPKPLLKSDVLTINDLKIGMKISGTVRNVVDFGAFIDIGLHNDGLAHISQLSNKFIKHPSEIVNVGDIVECYVLDISKEKEKVSLSLLKI